jgi:hypothetical protein
MNSAHGPKPFRPPVGRRGLKSKDLKEFKPAEVVNSAVVLDVVALQPLERPRKWVGC